jgi:hypothetical protein
MSQWDQACMDEAHDEAVAMLTVETPEADLSKLEGAPEAFEAGVWFGIAGTIAVLERHGIIKLPKDGESRE